MTGHELSAVLDKVIAKAEERKHDEYASDGFNVTDKAWQRVVKLMNLCTACRQVKSLLDKSNLADEEF